MTDPKRRCGVCRRSLFMEGVRPELDICSDCALSSMPDEADDASVATFNAIALWAAQRAWMFALEAQPDDLLIAPRGPGDPGPSRSRIRRRR